MDVNAISVNIGAIERPIVLFIGSISSGKTVSLVRLCHFISKHHSETLRWIVNERFRSDDEYINEINNFKEIMASHTIAPRRTNAIGFLLVDIYLKGELFCHILEAPGEHYYRADLPPTSTTEFPIYLNTLINKDVQKVAVYFYEDNLFNSNIKGADYNQSRYADQLATLHYRLKKKRDKAIILMNKVDKFHGGIHKNSIRDRIYGNENYNAHKNALSNHNLGQLQFVAFSSGNFQTLAQENPDENADTAWALGSDEYPKKLWKAIETAIKGSWWF